ncbi:MAG: DUF6705 family protein [Flavobacterium sp.]
MKKIYKLFSFLIFTYTYSQCNTITDLDPENSNVLGGVEGIYYKDLNNVLNNFEGTYLYNNGSTFFKMKLLKKIMSKNGTYNCEDMLIGGAEFITDGLLIWNTIPLLNTFFDDGFKYKLKANSIYTGDDRGCDECGINEKWLAGHITDPLTDQSCEIFIRKIIHNGQEAIKISFHIDITRRFYKEGTTPPPPMNIPYEDMILIKQP